MSVLSITYHCPEPLLSQWETFLNNDFSILLREILNHNQYIFSEVYSEMLNEGKNYNLLLIFENEQLRQDFLTTQYPAILQKVEANFGQEIMDFVTLLEPRFKKLD